MKICFLCNQNCLNKTDYFCYQCYRYLLIFYKITPLDLEEYLNLSFRDNCIFNFECCKSLECAYDYAKYLINDLKPLMNIAEYILLYKRMSNMIRADKLKNLKG